MFRGLFQSLRIALECLTANKLRSALTMLGVIIGVASVIVMVSIVEGARDQVLKEFEGMGSRLVIIFFSANERKRGEGRSHVEFLDTEDAAAIRRECSLVTDVSPELPMNQTDLEVGGEKLEGSLIGCQPEFARLHGIALDSGRFFSRGDYDSWSKVCVVGAEVAKKLWPKQNPLGQDLRAKGVAFTVIGVTKPKGRSMGEDPDKQVYAPLTTLQKRVTGDKRVWVIYAQIADVTQTETAADQIWALLMRRHNNQPDFTVDTQSRILEAINKVLAIFGLVLGGVGGLSLLVGGIGIMNIMLVSVTERTREIGIRKAIGAKRRAILLQFLIEASGICLIGGLLGVAIAWPITLLLQKAFPAQMSLPAVGIALGVSLVTGVVSGFLPAWRAARMNPVDALRNE